MHRKKLSYTPAFTFSCRSRSRPAVLKSLGNDPLVAFKLSETGISKFPTEFQFQNTIQFTRPPPAFSNIITEDQRCFTRSTILCRRPTSVSSIASPHAYNSRPPDSVELRLATSHDNQLITTLAFYTCVHECIYKHC